MTHDELKLWARSQPLWLVMLITYAYITSIMVAGLVTSHALMAFAGLGKP